MSATKNHSRSSRLARLTLGVLALLPTSAAAAPDLEQEIITTPGRGEVRVRPDSVRLEIGAEAQAATLEQARTEVSLVIQRIVQATNKLQIPGLSLRTQTIDFSPVRETRDSARRDEVPKIVGYRAVNTIAVTILGATPEDLGAFVSRIVDVGTKVGATNVGSITFFVHDIRDAQDRALAAAVRDARRSARVLARTAGVKLGRLHSIDGAPAFQGGLAKRSFELGVAPTPVLTGESVITSNVSVSFHFTGK